MSARNYAEKNAGRVIKINVKAASPSRANWPVGKVIGYLNDGEDYSIVLEMADVDDRHRCQPVGNLRNFIRTHVGEYDPPMGWVVNTDSVRHLRKKKATPKVISPYPHTCSRCNSPSRNCAEFVMCSNYKCKTRVDVRKLFKPAVAKAKGRWIRCATCGRHALNSRGGYDTNDNRIYTMSCPNGHNWTGDLKKGDLLRTSLQTGIADDRMWDGRQWVAY